MNSGVYASKGTDWIKFTNGLLIQWGVDSGTATFPQPFSDTSYIITMARSGNSYEWVPSYRDKTTTTVNVQCSDKSWVWHSTEVNWIAIGF